MRSPARASSIRIVTPYFLPPEVLTTALGLAAMRGLAVDIVVPEHSNHKVLDWARRIPLRLLLEAGCRIWLRPGAVRSLQADDDRRQPGR
jgi:cardiolipin synthase